MLDFSKVEFKTEPFYVYIWPDGVWSDEAPTGPDYAHMSDDYVRIDLNDHEAVRDYPNPLEIRHILGWLYSMPPGEI